MKPPFTDDPNNTRNCTSCGGNVVVNGTVCPSCLARQESRNKAYNAGKKS